MQKVTSRPNIIGRGSVLTPKQRAAILRRTRGTWKRALKSSLRTLATIRRGLDRKIV